MNRSLYVDRFEAHEKKQLFEDNWIPVCLTNEFPTPDSYKAYDLPNGESVIVTGQYKVFYNTCRHRGNQLVDIEDCVQQDQRITCRYHCWSYDLNGTLVSTPLCQHKHLNLYEIKDVMVVNHIVMIYIGTSKIRRVPIQLLPEYPIQSLQVVFRDQYTVQANWKLLMQNFCCWYHVPFIHPALTKVSGVNEHAVVTFNDTYLHFKTDPITFDPSSPIQEESIVPMGPRVRKNVAHFIVLFPNTFLFIFPDHVFQVVVTPLTDTTSREQVYLLVSPHTSNIEALVQFYTETNNEDIAICESVQKGLRNKRYQGGPYVLPYESATQAFDQWYLKHQSTKSSL